MSDRALRAEWRLLVYPDIRGAASERLELVGSYQRDWRALSPSFLTFSGLGQVVGTSRSFTIATGYLNDEGWDVAAVPVPFLE